MKKKVLSLIVSMCMLLSCFTSLTSIVYAAETVIATGKAGDNITWELDSNGLLTFSGTGLMYVDSYDYPWLVHSEMIKNIKIGHGINSVLDSAFFGCENLETVEIPYTVLNIGQDAFYYCPYDLTVKGYTGSVAEWTAAAFGYTFVSLGEAIAKSYATGTLGNTNNLKWELDTLGVLTISGAGSMGWIGYENAPWESIKNFIRHIVIEEGVTDIASYAFYDCDILTDIQIASTVTDIWYDAFEYSYMMGIIKGYDDTAAEEFADEYGYEFVSLGAAPVITILSGKCGDSISWTMDNYGILKLTGTGAMPDYANQTDAPWYEFRDAVKKVEVSEGITSLAKSSFYNCTNLNDVTLPDSITTIGNYAFCNCYALKSVKLPDSLTTLGSYAFYYCEALESITMHYNVTSIGNGALSGVSNSFVLKGYTSSYAEEYANINYIEFESIGEAPLVTVASGSCGENVTWTYDNHKTLTISGSGNTVDLLSYSYSQPEWEDYKSYIKKIVIENGVTGIGEYLFKGTYSVTDVTIADSVTSIGSSAFFNCSCLKTVTIPASVTNIGSSAFSQCPSDMIIKGYTPSVAEDFANNNSFTFESIGVMPVTVIASGNCGDKLTWTLDNYGLLKIEGTGDMSYTGSSSGGSSSGTIGGEIGGDIAVGLLSASETDVPWYSYRTKIKKLEISEGVTSIEDYAFYYCTYLAEVSLPETLVSIGKYSFRSCSRLTAVTLPQGLKSIEKYAFAYCTNLKTVTTHYNMDAVIDSYAFNGSYNVVIKGYTGSYAEEYATNYNIAFESIGEAPLRVLASGNVNNDIIWSLNSKGLLKIEGTGDMPLYENSSDIPWYAYMSKIKSVEISGVESIQRHTFVYCTSLTSVVLDGVKSVGYFAFSDCNFITEITIPATMERMDRNAFGYIGEDVTIKGIEGTYAQMYAEYLGCNFEKLDGEFKINEVSVSTVEELIAAIASNTTIILEDGIYVLDRSSYLGDKEYTWKYADTIRICDVINLTIKARNPGMVEIIAPQKDDLNNYSYENAPFVVQGAYNLTFDGIRMGNMKMNANNGSNVKGDDVQLLGGYDENSLSGYNGVYFGSSVNTGSDNYADMTYPVLIQNKASFINCDIFNCAYGIAFSGNSLIIDNCTVRDNVKGAVSANGDVQITNSVFSNNGNSAAYKGTYCLNLGSSATIENCVFINNGNDNYVSCESLTEDGNIYSNNGWNSAVSKAYGITKNGITWQVSSINDENVLKLGYAVNADSLTLESKTGTVYPYTVNSAPWRSFDIDVIDMAEGVDYANIIHGGCGENVTWQFVPETKTLIISGTGNMSYIYSDLLWGAYNEQIENIVIENTVTGVYNNFHGTAFTANRDNWENGVINGTLYIGDVLVRANYQATGEFRVKEGTRVIAKEAFYNIDGITSIVLPEGVQHIGITEKLNNGEGASYGAFANCSNLKSLTIPKSVKSFEHAMVYNCNSLTDIYYSGTMAEWEAISKGKNNTQLTYCTIYCADGIISQNPYIHEVNVYRESDTSIVITTDMQFKTGKEKVYIAGCDVNGEYVAVNSEADGNYYYINGDEEILDKISYVKIFVWQNMKTLKPMCKPLKVAVDN